MNDQTPYDTGARLEPKVWDIAGDDDRYGRVDFDNDESGTEFTVCAKRDNGRAVLEVSLLAAADNFTVIVDGAELHEPAPVADNTQEPYWWAHPCTEPLARMSGRSKGATAAELAYIAGDYANMPDGDVLATFMNENEED